MHPVCLVIISLSSIIVASAPFTHNSARLDTPRIPIPWKAFASQQNATHPLYRTDHHLTINPLFQTHYSRHRSTSFLSSTDSYPSLLSAERQGLTFEICCEQSDCQSSLQCLDIPRLASEEAPSCSFNSLTCACLNPDGVLLCSRTAECPPGEICTVLVNSPDERLCISADAVPYSQAVSPIDASNSLLSGESCFSSTQCREPRLCIGNPQPGNPSRGECTTPGQECTCRLEDEQDAFCSSDEDCPTDGEVCAYNERQDFSCLSEAFVAGRFEFHYKAVTGELCFFDDNCLGTRTCPDSNGGPCRNPTGCRCVPEELQPCITNNDCTAPLEICARSTETGEQTCVYQFTAKGVNTAFEPPRSLPTPTPDKSPVASPTSSSSPLASSSVPTPTESPASSSLASASPAAASPAAATPNPSAAVESVPVTPSPVPTEDPICVDAAALSHLSPSELVFPKHAPARVLCDVHGSCATPGHIVFFKGYAMRMSSYCRMVGCSGTVIHVNSPRYKRRLRIKTKTEGLEFTAFAARYDTRAEEVVLASAVRVGL